MSIRLAAVAALLLVLPPGSPAVAGPAARGAAASAFPVSGAPAAVPARSASGVPAGAAVAVRAVVAVRAPAAPAGAFRWPLDGTPPVLRRFDPPPQPWQAGHRGVDLGSHPGAVVRAAGPGTVVFAGTIAGRGVVSIGHGNGLRTTYEPVDVPVTLRAGFPVVAGEQIGALTAGHPGCPVAACLHWGLRRGEQYLDPLLLLGLGRVRLLPL